MTVAKLRGAVEAGTLCGMEIKGLRRVIVKGKQLPVTLYQVIASAATPGLITECADLEPLRLTEK
jgi:adenylate cyclase